MTVDMNNLPPCGCQHECQSVSFTICRDGRGMIDYDQAVRAGHSVTFWVGPIDPYGDLPGGRGWLPYNREVIEAAKARGEEVTINTAIKRTPPSR